MKFKTNKRFLSLILAISMTLTSFAGLTVTTASADGEPTLSDWNFEDYYSEDFDYTDQSDATVILEKSGNAWTWSDTTGFTLARGYKVYQKAFNMKWTRWAQYEIPSDRATDVIAFQYTIQTKGTTQYVSIVDSSNAEVAILDQTAASSEYKTFTTVIDTTTKKIYTFMPDGTVDTNKSYTGDGVKAIRFGNTSNESDFNFLMSSFAYKKEASVPSLSDWEFENYYSTDFDYTDQSDASVINADANNAWTWSDTTGFTLARGYKIYQKAFNMKWTRWAQYEIPSDSTKDIIAFQYTIQTKGTTQYVSIVDSNNAETAILDQTAAPSEYKTFTTVIDTNKKKIYTFMPNGTVDMSKSYTGDGVKAIRFGNTTNESDFNFLISDFAYKTGEAAKIPSLSDWEFENYYSTDFDYEDQSDASVVNADANNAWTWSDSVGFTSARGYKIYNKALTIKWTRWTQYNIPSDSATDVIAFEYNIQTKGTTQYVSIIDGDNNEIALLDQTAAASAAKTFTTVIDTNKKKIYTFMPDGTVDISKSYTGNSVKAIRFGNTSNESDFSYNVNDFAYKIEKSVQTLTIGIDYEKAQLTGFTEGESYTVKVGDAVETSPVTINDDGTVDILDAWYGKKLTIAKDDVSTEVTLAAQPSAPAVTQYTIVNENGETKNGAVKKSVEATNNLEYYDSAAEDWKELTTTGVTDLKKGDTVEIRIKGVAEDTDGETVTTQGVFPSAATTVTVGRISGVSLDTDGGDYADAGDAFTTYVEGTAKDLPTGLTKTGYTFGNWYDETDNGETPITAIPDTATGNKSYKAIWTAMNYTITNSAADDGEGNTTKNGYVTVDANADYKSTVTITLVPNNTAEYVLDSLTVTGTDEISTTKVSDTSYTFEMPNEAVTVDATFKEKTYTVVATAGANVTKVTLTRQSDSKSQTVSISEGKATFTLPKGTYDVSAEFETGYVLDNATSDGTYEIVADAASNAFTVNAKAATDPAITGSVSITGTPTVGQTLTAVPAITSAGDGAVSYQWKAKGADDAEYQNIGTNAATYTLTKAEEGKTIIVVVTKTGYSDSLTSAATNAVAPKTYTVKGTVGAGVASVKLQKGSDAPITGDVSEGVITFTDVLEGTYTVVVEKESTYKSASSDPETITVNDENATAYATKAFEATAIAYANPTVTIETYDTDKGTVTVTGGVATITTGNTTAKETDTITVTSEANTGYSNGTLKYKVGSGSYTDVPQNGQIIVGTEAITIQATYTTDTYNIDKAEVTGGSITVNTTAEYGSRVSVSLTPDIGYEAGAITVTGKTSSNNIAVTSGSFTMPAEDVTVSAAFTQKNHTVTNSTLEADKTENNGHLTVDKTSNVHYNDSVKITIVPADGYELDTLTVNKATSGTVTPTKSNDTTYTFTMPDDNVTISATFKAVTPADPTSKLSYWTQGDKAFNAAEGYPIDFENYNTGVVTLGDKWTPTSGANNEIWIRTGSAAANQDKVLAIAQQKSVTLNEAQTDKVFYYTYSVQSWSEDQDSKQVVKLAGVDNSNLVVSPLSGTRVVETYTTVVDPVTAKKAYTYNADGDLVGTVDLGSSTVTGISFINNETASKALWIDEIEYGTIGKKSVPKVIISDYDNEQGTMTVTVDSHAISSDTEVEVGTDVTVTIAAAQDYEVNTFTVGGEDKKDELNEGSYTFTMPDENVTIAVTFKSTVVEPDPEGPAFSEWGITDYTETEDYKEFYEDHFKGYDGYIGDMARAEKLEGKEHEPLPKAYWTVLAGKDGTDVLLRDTIGSAETGFMQVKHASNGTGSGSVKYTNDVESDTYYYQYDLRIGKGEIEVKLAGTGLTNDVIIAVADGDVAMATYTTVVDTENKKVYTYKGDTLINVNEIGSGEVTGIIFSHVASDTASITNTGYADIDRFGHYYVEKAVDPEANSKVKITGYDNTQGTVTVTAGETTITSGSAEIAKDTQVTVTIESEEGYEIDTFTVDGMDKKSELSEDVYSFTMPETDITITVTFKTTGGGAPEPPTPGEYPTLSDWADELGDAAYTFEFDKTLTDDDMFGEDGIWSTDGATGNQGDVWQRNDSDKTVLQIRNGKSATLTKAPSDLYYYTYTLANYGNGNTVKLEGINDNLIKEYTGNEAYTKYTVVVDTRADSDSKGVYIYSGDDTSAQPIEVKEIGADEAVTGITFESLEGKNVYMYLDSFAYGLKKGATDLDPYNPGGDDPTPPPTDEPVNVESKLSDWDLTEPTSTEKFDGKSITKLQEDDWKFGNTNAGANFNEKHVIINGSGELEVNWYGTATYAKTDEENPYYYTYTVKTKDTTGIRSVNLSGVDNSTMLVSGKEITSSDRTFTTVVDANSKKAYTYDNATGDFVSVVDVPNPAAVKGITFSGGTVNTSVGMQVDNVSYGLVNVTPPEKPVTIVLKGDKVNDGEALENGQTYDVTGEKFTETVIKLDEPYTVKDDKTLLFMTNSIVITPPSNANGNIVVDGTKITALEALTAGTYDISITVSSSYKGEEYGSETYTISFIKPEVTNTDIENDYEPVITTETVDGKETAVNTTGEGDPTEVYNDLELPTETSFADITWTSDTPSVISNNGAIVKRPLEDKTVTLTAIIANKYNSGSTVSKQITVTVKGVGSMLDDAISKATAIVSADTDETVDLTDLHEDIKIYTKYENDAYPEANEVTLEWSSDNDVLRINGSTAEIYPTTTNEYKVKLTVKATALGAEKTKDIDVTVHLTKANAGDKYAVRCDDLVASNFSEVANLSGDIVSSNISVPTEGLFGSTISWTSSVPMYMSNTGKYTAPSSNTNVTMTGIVSKGKVISDKKHAYSFTVKGKSNNQSGGSGGGGGSSSGGSSSSYSLPMNTGTTTPTTNNQPSNAGNYNPNANTEPEGFTDLGNVAWAEEAINALADKGIISGRSEHIFDPDANITRAEFATIIVKAFGFEDENASVDEFTDVNADDWYYSFVAAAYNNGIISGYDNGSFGSYDNITRQDMAVIIYRAANATGVELDEINEGKTFDDEASIAAYAADAVDALVKAGVINGMTDTEFAPTANATRAQAAKMTYELVK